MWELIYLVLYLIGKSTEFVYNNKVIFILFLIVCIIVFDVYDLLIHKNENSNIGRIIITNLIVITTIGITTLTNKALISSMILIVFDFIIIYSLLFLIKKVTEYLNR
jgi:quinol-cytochrome oxidoreductase complex cytochrome b subunit